VNACAQHLFSNDWKVSVLQSRGFLGLFVGKSPNMALRPMVRSLTGMFPS
jgi:hypothetical protein